jgi:hypothetical protein
MGWTSSFNAPALSRQAWASMSYTNLLPGRIPSRPRRIQLDIRMLRDSVFVR